MTSKRKHRAVAVSPPQRRKKMTKQERMARIRELSDALWFAEGEDYHCFITNLENWLKEKYGLEVE